MHGDMIRFIALDFILRIVATGVMRVSLVIHILRMDLDNPAADQPGLGIPGNMIAGFESFCHIIPESAMGALVQHAPGLL